MVEPLKVVSRKTKQVLQQAKRVLDNVSQQISRVKEIPCEDIESQTGEKVVWDSAGNYRGSKRECDAWNSGWLATEAETNCPKAI